MSDIIMGDGGYNNSIVSHLDLLKRIGILDHIENLKKQIKEKDKLLDEVTELLNQTTRIDLINFVTTRMLNELVPMNLVFVVQSEYSIDEAEVISYNRLKRVDNGLRIDSLKPYRIFFSLYPGLTAFEEFREKIDKKQHAEIFASYNPEFIMPLLGLGGMFGFIIFGKKVIGPEYTAREIEYIKKIITCVSVSLQNSMYYKSAIMDEKTDIYTHHFFLKRFHEELSRVLRYNMTLSIIMLDLDHFKKVNDTYGHTAGDKVLYEVARTIEKHIRKGDVAARFGGEEYIVLLIECKTDHAFTTAERIRKAVEESPITYLGEEIRITLSCGITSISGSKDYNSDEIIRQADKALYSSKQNGRNKTTVYKK